MNEPSTIPSPARLRSRIDKLDGQRERLLKDQASRHADLAAIDQYLNLAPAVDEALEKLSQELFGKLTEVIERQLSNALREVLEQDLALKVDRDYKRGAATMSFHIERSGNPEDIMKGQGGSVANVLSIGLRLRALMTLDPSRHRRFLVLDEQDCWLRPDLVPKLAKIVRDAGRALGFQVLMISHHDSAIFERYADRIYRFTPTSDGVQVEAVGAAPDAPDTDHA